MDIKELIKNDVKFSHFRQGYFYYNVGTITVEKTETGSITDIAAYQFPVHIDDIGTATMLDKDKGITFMRWIRKAMDDKTLIQL